MGRKKKTLHDYAAEFHDLAVKRHVVEQHDSGERTRVEILYCKSCEVPVRVRRDRILEHLASARHYRNRRLIKQQWDRKPVLVSAPSDLHLPVKLGSSSLTSQPPLLTGTPGCSVSSCSSSLPPPSLPLLSSSKSSTSSAATSEATPSTSDNQPQNFSSGRVRSPPLPGWASNPWLERTTNSIGVRAGAGGGAGLGVGVGLALFGVSTGSRALCHSLVVENGCQLLYIVEDQRWELEGVFSQEHLTHTRVLRSLDTDIVLRDQCVSGVVVCSPPDEASVIVLDALRAGKGVFCEKLPSLNRHIAESCFDEASRCGKPLVCGFFKRFDPALQFLYKRVHENETLGRIQRISTVSRMYPPPSVAAIKSSGGIFYNTAVHDIDVICWLLGESAPDTIFSLGHAFCREMAAVKEPDSISVSMKFPSGAIASLDTSQHCNKSCDQRLEVHGTEGSLQMDNRNPLGISDHSTSAALCLQDTAERYRDAYRELLRHFLRTLRGRESPFFTKEQYLWTIQVAAAAEQSWRNGSAVDLRNEALDTTIIKTEVQ
ncbi:myo-inositol 2-dehydrogenase-like [Acipenser ruthenus]|uniref:myo-inositol 2-dehydrogenase-like n=1 Tax=Acipenser ruthenus TaxID=7906 RepID=UPI0027425336|nr:myo-inositol 2-dehydrogenase-like [Acipenser ruthenus]XP_058849077.1 myo-inositol 2-dehydrogenase-like [Acipenser ruthenus]XP_058849078.1 myo-inositol 2-dehydrogenase-like [Acipenser ruthenus]XP_058849079.1 myo-inositol 2-dehydrogenase-like [Acipenser ruthenus]XP_058849080.1 myo-inositol 2-dehydrogenase-like [Acipenser ruthenus]XP_058849081.1 myo-inositol 2-dehydrogenase-like [Acipenser ruthenus]